MPNIQRILNPVITLVCYTKQSCPTINLNVYFDLVKSSPNSAWLRCLSGKASDHTSWMTQMPRLRVKIISVQTPSKPPFYLLDRELRTSFISSDTLKYLSMKHKMGPSDRWARCSHTKLSPPLFRKFYIYSRGSISDSICSYHIAKYRCTYCV